MEDRSSHKRRLTRRHVLKTGAAALGAGTGLLNGPPVLDAQSTQAPAVRDRHADGPGLPRPRPPRQHARRSGDAAAADRSAAGGHPLAGRRALLHDRAAARSAPTRPGEPEVPNHCGFGVVEAVGPMVKRVQVGDRVVVAGTSQCGQCYQCLQGRPDYCQFTFFSNAPGRRAVSAVRSVSGRHAVSTRRQASAA